MEKFLAELNEKFTVEDFTGHLGVLFAYMNGELDEDDEDTEGTVNACFNFLQELQDIAYKHV